MPLEEFLHREPEALPPDATCAAAARRMRGANVGALVVAVIREVAIRRVVVVDDSGGLVGVVSMDDLLMRLAEDFAGLAEAIRKELAPTAG